MPVTQSSLSGANIVNGLQESGLCRGDLVHLQVADAAFGTMDGSLSEIERCELLLNATREVIGQEGTLFVPAFSLSFLHNEPFDPDRTAAVGGEWNTSIGFWSTSAANRARCVLWIRIFPSVGWDPRQREFFAIFPPRPTAQAAFISGSCRQPERYAALARARCVRPFFTMQRSRSAFLTDTRSYLPGPSGVVVKRVSRGGFQAFLST